MARVLIVTANGSNRDHDVALAVELAGGTPEIVHVNQLFSGQRRVDDYAMLVLPGGFSYGDDLGAGKLWALEMTERLGADMRAFVGSGRPAIGICNGFQALVKAEILPGLPKRRATLTYNQSGHFECRWVHLEADPDGPCQWTRDLEMVYCPVAHGEGRLMADKQTLRDIEGHRLVALRYVKTDGGDAMYPDNPNGSPFGIAGLTNLAGNVLGLMPHPENHIFDWQHPRWRRGEVGGLGLELFRNGIKLCG